MQDSLQMKTLTAYKNELQQLHYDRADIWSEYSRDLDIFYKNQIHDRMHENAEAIGTLIKEMIAAHPRKVLCYKTPRDGWCVRTGLDTTDKNAIFNERWMAESYAKQWRKLGLNVDCRTLNNTWDPYGTRK